MAGIPLILLCQTPLAFTQWVGNILSCVFTDHCEREKQASNAFSTLSYDYCGALIDQIVLMTVLQMCATA